MDSGVLFPCSTISLDFPTIEAGNNILLGLKRVFDLLQNCMCVLSDTMGEGRQRRLGIHASSRMNKLPSVVYLSKLSWVYTLITGAESGDKLELADYCLAMHPKFLDK